MRKKNGFTLVELLVVMAIISILAAIAIPNVQKWIRKGRATRALTEIQNMELAITKVLSDAGRSSIKDLINQDTFNELVIEDHTGIEGPLPATATIKDWDAEAFDIAVELYTNTMYGILRVGRESLGNSDINQAALSGNLLLNEEIVRQLGTSYMSQLGRDPWGNLYRIYPGPWLASNGLIPFRTYLPPVAGDTLPGDDTSASAGDALSLGSATPSGFPLTDPITGDEIDRAGVPANTKLDVYIWSFGENLISGQARFYHPNVKTYDASDNVNNYEGGQEPEFMGGGDDINNWDQNATYMQFYN